MGNSVSAEVQLLQEKFKAAIEEGNAEEIKNLLSAGAMPSYVYHTDMDDLETSSTYSPMIAAVVANQDCAVKLLLEAKADVDFWDDVGWTAFLYACCSDSDNLAIVDMMLEYVPHIAHTGTYLGYTPLMLSSNCGKGDVVRSLLAAGVEVNACASGSYGCPISAINFATRYRDHDEDVHGRNDETIVPEPIHLNHSMFGRHAGRGSRTDAIISLVDAGARVNDMDQATEGCGRTPILQAIYYDDFVAMLYLLTGGADTSLTSVPIGAYTVPFHALELATEKVQPTGKFLGSDGSAVMGGQVDKEVMPPHNPNLASQWKVAKELIIFSLGQNYTGLDGVKITGPEFMHHLYFEWRLIRAVGKKRGPDTSIALSRDSQLKVKGALSDAYNELWRKLAEAAHTVERSTEHGRLALFLFTCPSESFSIIQEFLGWISTSVMEQWFDALDTLLAPIMGGKVAPMNRATWEQHWNKRLELTLRKEWKVRSGAVKGKGFHADKEQRFLCF